MISIGIFQEMAMKVPLLTRIYIGSHVNRTIIRYLSQRQREERTKALLDKIIRVDHAGELGAKRIYQGQLAVLKDTPTGPVIQVRADWSPGICLGYGKQNGSERKSSVFVIL